MRFRHSRCQPPPENDTCNRQCNRMASVVLVIGLEGGSKGKLCQLSNFAHALGREYPSAIARLNPEHAGPDHVPITDIGCGTGLVAEALALRHDQTDGIDISKETLAISRRKAIDRMTIQADLGSGPIKNAYPARLCLLERSHPDI